MQKQLSTLKIQTSNSCKELFHNFNAILGKKNSTPLPLSLDSDDVPQAFFWILHQQDHHNKKQLSSN